MLARLRSIYPALTSTLAYSWAPLTVALFAIAVIFSRGAGATR
jgi:hypothetical protein